MLAHKDSTTSKPHCRIQKSHQLEKVEYECEAEAKCDLSQRDDTINGIKSTNPTRLHAHTKHTEEKRRLLFSFICALIVYGALFAWIFYKKDLLNIQISTPSKDTLTIALSALQSENPQAELPKKPKPKKIQKPKPKQPQTKLEPKKDLQKIQENVAPTQSVEKIQEKQEIQEAQEKETQEKDTREETSDSSTASTARVQNNTAIDDAFSLEVKRIILSYHKYPSNLRSMGIKGDVSLEFSISVSGGLESYKILQTSGVQALDSLALKTLTKASKKFPKPQTPRTLTITLSYNTRR
ncbi:hypothetical protein CQA49_00125 [Helicobacter sp. MIT 00-7814]|nr:hypothetical protein CQA49_00125 [Helicobacter sp. MIT 00-7814]RDU57662.1 hypothetical protein CQA37_00125 [Helicobacter sp. MIT 99-10781]